MIGNASYSEGATSATLRRGRVAIYGHSHSFWQLGAGQAMGHNHAYAIAYLIFCI